MGGQKEDPGEGGESKRGARSGSWDTETLIGIHGTWPVRGECSAQIAQGLLIMIP